MTAYSILRSYAAWLSLLTLCEAKQDTCTALVMSGGGTNGAWESGVLWGLLHYGDHSDYEYDVVTGVSIGSINASALSAFEIGNELEAVDFIYDAWEQIQTSDIYQEWPNGLVAGLYKVSLLDTSPGIETMKGILGTFDDYKRAISLSAVDIDSGAVISLTNENTKFEDLYKAVMASASVPGVFPPTEINGLRLIDGMTAYNTNAQEAIDRCRELVDDDSKITIDVMICDKLEDINVWTKAGNSWTNYWRASDIKKAYIGSNATAGVMRANPKINWRHTISQSYHVTGKAELDFSNEVTGPLQEAGKKDAMTALEEMRVRNTMDVSEDEEDYDGDWTSQYITGWSRQHYQP